MMENHENSNVTSYTQPKLSEQQRMEQLRLQQQLTFGETPQQKAKRADIFSVMMVPTLVYAMLYTFLLYDNFHSITLPLFVVVTIGYCVMCWCERAITADRLWWCLYWYLRSFHPKIILSRHCGRSSRRSVQ